MKTLDELQQEIDKARTELEDAMLQGKSFDSYYPKSVYLDQLIEEYLDLKEKLQVPEKI